MAQDIVQVMGFDIGDSVSKVQSLGTALNSLSKSFLDCATGMKQWNSAAKDMAKLATLGDKVNRLTNQYNALAKAQAKLGNTPNVGTQDTLSKQLSLVKQLTNTWGNIPKSNPMAQQMATLQAAAAQYAARMQMSSTQVATAFQLMGTGGSFAVRQLGSQFAAMSALSAKALQSIQSTTGGISIALGSMLKYKAFSMVMSGIASLITSFKEGTQAAADFSRQLGQIQTVADGADMGLIENQLKAISSKFGTPIKDVSSAYYLTLQNQVGDAAESMNVLEQASKIAAATGSNLTDVVDTLTVSLTGFKMRASQSGDVAGKLFKAMEIGRFQFSDMKDTMGRVDGMANELDISLSQLLGPIATMTRQGVRFDTAVTQMRAVISQMLKPTKDLKKLYENWGVTGVEQAIQKWGGFLPMLKATENAFGGNSAALAKAFTNLRAFTGMMGMLGSNYEMSLRDTKEIEQANVDVADKVFATFAATEGQKYVVVLNQIKLNFMEIGKALLPVAMGLAKISEAVTSSPMLTLGALTSVIAGLTGAVIAATVAFAGLQTTSVAAAMASLTAWSKTLTGGALMWGGIVAAAFGVGFAIGMAGLALWDWMRGGEKALQAEFDKMRASSLKWEEDQKAIRARSTQDQIDQAKKTTSAMIMVLTERQKLQARITEDTIRGEKASLQIISDTLDKAVDLQKRKTDKLMTSATGQDQPGILKNIADATVAYGNKKFDFQNAYEEPNKAKQAANELMRSDTIRYGALSKLRSANTKEEFDAIKSQLDMADQYAQKASSSGAALADKQFQKRAEKASVTLANDRVRIAQQELKVSKQTQKDAIRDYPKQLELLTQIADVRAKMADTMLTKGKSKEEVNQNKKDFKVYSKQMTDLLTQAGQGVSGDSFVQKITDELASMALQMPTIEKRVEFIWADSYSKLTAAVEKMPIEIVTKFKLDPIDPFGSLATAIEEKRNALGALTAKKTENQLALDSTNRNIKQTSNFGKQGQTISTAEEFTIAKKGQALSDLEKAYNNVIMLAKQYQAVPITAENFADKKQELETLYQARKKYNDLAATSGAEIIRTGNIGTDQERVLANLSNMLKTLNQDINTLDQAKLTDVDTEFKDLSGELETLRGLMINGINLNVVTDLTKFSDADIAIKGMQGGIDTFMTAITGATPPLITFADLMVKAADAGQKLANYVYPTPPMPVVPTGPGSAMGGYQRFASGGRAQGTDTIPAMLSKGEYVMNAKSTRRFFSQLVAMNSGVAPIYRQDGGSVTNIGDINVSVTGGSTSKQSARDIATALRREMRRGTARL